MSAAIAAAELNARQVVASKIFFIFWNPQTSLREKQIDVRDVGDSAVFRVIRSMEARSLGSSINVNATFRTQWMRLNFRGPQQNLNGYSDQPFTFVDPEAHQLIAHMASIDLIENGGRR